MAGFEFALGEWNYITKEKREDGSYRDWPVAYWKFWYILGTQNVQDEFIQPTPDGDEIRGTCIRAYDSQTSKWVCRGVGTSNDQWSDYEAIDHGHSIVMSGVSPQIPNAVERVTFHDYKENSWRRDLDISFDEGETWLEKIAIVEATRV